MAISRKVKIGDICKIRRGASPRPIQNYISKEGIPWLKIADATKSDGKYIYETREFIIESGRSKSVEVFPGDFILSNSATPGIPKFMKINACIHDGWLLLKPNTKLVDENYLYHNLKYERKNLVNKAYGAVFNNLKTDTLREYEISLPEIETQKRIAKILDDYDELIEINTRKITAIEEMAQALYKEWFVNFKFPGHENVKFVDSELGNIPEGWCVNGIMDVPFFRLINENVKSYDGDKNYLATADVDGIYTTSEGIRYTFKEKPSRAQKQPVINSVWFARMKDSYKILLYSEANDDIAKDSVISSGFVGFEALDGTLPFLFEVIASKDFNNKKNLYATGATQVSLNNESLSKIQILIPEISIVKQFSEKTTDMINQILLLQKMNNNLRQQRDLLLPKLMSGEIEV